MVMVPEFVSPSQLVVHDCVPSGMPVTVAYAVPGIEVLAALPLPPMLMLHVALPLPERLIAKCAAPPPLVFTEVFIDVTPAGAGADAGAGAG